jgi:hypothetical protein
MIVVLLLFPTSVEISQLPIGLHRFLSSADCVDEKWIKIIVAGCGSRRKAASSKFKIFSLEHTIDILE